MPLRVEPGSGGAILIMGVSGSGKSTLAALLARQIGCAFLEGDDFHAAASVAKMRRGEPLTDADRWPWLDRLGQAIGQAVAADGCAVASCSALRRSYRDRLRQVIAAPLQLVLVEASRAELLRRMAARPGHYMPASLLDSQLATFERPAADEAVLTLSGNLPPDALARAVRRHLGECGWPSRPRPESR